MLSNTRATQDKVEILYVKAKVYIHPTTSKKNNIAGYLVLCRPKLPNSTNKDILLRYTPEYMLSENELKIYESFDLDVGVIGVADQLESLSVPVNTRQKQTSKNNTRPILDCPPSAIGGSGAFCVNLSNIYSIQFRTPSLGWWYGSIVIHCKSREKLPVLFFHDDESPSTLRQQRIKNSSFDPFGEDGEMYWGGQDFLSVLEGLIAIERTIVEPTVYLIDPSSSDLINFSPFSQEQPKKTSVTTSKDDFKLSNFTKLLATAKWKVLDTVATIGQRTKNQVVDLIDERVPSTVVKSILSKPEVLKISNDFDSARIYLANWAVQVKEEAEESQQKFMLDDAIYTKINDELGVHNNLLTPQEISNASRRKPITMVEWMGFFDQDGKFTSTIEEVKSRIFHGGLQNEVRKKAWPFLLGMYPWDSSRLDRKAIKESFSTSYCDFKRRWTEDEPKRLTEFWKDQKGRIEKDVHRNDRDMEIFKDNKRNISYPSQSSDIITRESSPETPEEDEEWSLGKIDNVHLYRMREILLTFNEYNTNLGYVQGMTDLLSPIYVIFKDEVLSFWAFARFMNRMERNFVRDQSGIKKQMLVLNELVRFMLPELFRHLEKCESTDLFFFFRMLLVWFKREFDWVQVNTLWEVLWTDYYSSQYHLFLALAILSDNERIMMQNLCRFDEVLKFMNDLSGRLKLNELLVRAELLFLRFRRMVNLIDRESKNFSNMQEIKINPDLRELFSRRLIVQREVERPEGASGG